MKYNCFDLHPCKHCGRHTHSSDRCFRNKPPTRTKIHLGWIASWQWASAAKKMFTTHVRTCSRILNKLAVEFSPSSHLVPDRGENGGHVQASTTDQASLSHNLSFHVQSCSQRHSSSSEPEPQFIIPDSKLYPETWMPMSMPSVGGQH